MKNFAFYGLSISAASALLAGCGGSQPPVGAPATSAQAWRTHRVVRHSGLTSSYQVLHRFARNERHQHGGANPAGGLIDVAGTLYGTTSSGGVYNCGGFGGCGTVFSVSPLGAKKVLHDFDGASDDGILPTGDLTNLNGTLYGTTVFGGAGVGGCGSVYSVTTKGIEKVLHSFCASTSAGNPIGGVINVEGTLYGTDGPSAFGDVYSITTSGAYKVLHAFRGGYGDGAGPDARLLNVKGTLYGTTLHGGSGRYGSCAENGGCGVVYSISTSGKEKVLYSFQNGSDGWLPESGLIYMNGTLYGTTYYGGGSGCYSYNGCGTVYSVSTNGTEKVLYRFTGGSDGGNPNASLLEIGGTLYGTTTAGGAVGHGAVFSVSLSGSERALHSFGGPPDGADPNADLIDVNETLYGTTNAGGARGCGRKGCGTIFALTP